MRDGIATGRGAFGPWGPGRDRDESEPPPDRAWLLALGEHQREPWAVLSAVLWLRACGVVVVAMEPGDRAGVETWLAEHPRVARWAWSDPSLTVDLMRGLRRPGGFIVVPSASAGLSGTELLRIAAHFGEELLLD